MSVYTSLENKVHKSLQNDFWLQFLDAIADELDIQKTEKKAKITLNDVDSEDDEDLFALSSKYGYDPNLIVDDSFDFLQKSVKSITYRIKNKTTTRGYEFSFEMIDRSGAVYNTSYDAGLSKVLDYDSTVDYVEDYEDGDTFNLVVPETIFFSTSSTGDAYLDEDRTLDSEVTWTLDSEGTTETTKHLCVEFLIDQVITEDEESYMITDDYIEYMISEVNYNRRVTAIPHVGIQINSVIDVSSYYNKQSGDDDYTIPTLELQSAIIGDFTSIDDYAYFVIGIGKKGLCSYDYTDINDDVLLQIPFTDQENGSSLLDASGNYSSNTIEGNTLRGEGIIGSSLTYTKDTYCTIPSFTFPSDNWTINFWGKITAEKSYGGSTRYLISHENINLSFDETNQVLNLELSDGTTTYSLELEASMLGSSSYIQIEYDITNELVNVYYDTELQDSLDVADNVGFTTSNDLILGAEYSTLASTTMFNGVLDEFSVHQRLFSTDEQSFLYDNQYGDHTYLGNRVYRIALNEMDKEDKTDSSDYLFLQGIGKGNTVNDDLIFTGDGSTETITDVCRFYPVVEGSIAFSLTDSGGNTDSVVDDGEGNLEGDTYSGTIDYDTGEYTLNFYNDIDIDNDLYSGDGEISDISMTLIPTIEEISFQISYTIDSVTYTSFDNGSGTISGENIDSGTIDYDTGEVAITLSTANDVDTNILYSYTYRLEDIPSTDIDVTLSFQTEDDLEITECGYENSDKELLQYTAFPKCQFGTPKAYLTNNTIINTTAYEEYYQTTASGDYQLTADGSYQIGTRRI